MVKIVVTIIMFDAMVVAIILWKWNKIYYFSDIYLLYFNKNG